MVSPEVAVHSKKHQKGRTCLSGETATACFHRAMVRPSNRGATGAVKIATLSYRAHLD